MSEEPAVERYQRWMDVLMWLQGFATGSGARAETVNAINTATDVIGEVRDFLRAQIAAATPASAAETGEDRR